MTTQLVNMASLLAAAAIAAPLLALSASIPSALADDDSCSFELSAPQATTLPGGGAMVTATVRAIKCTGLAQATDAFVCVTNPAGVDQCKRSPAWSTAQVYVAGGGNGIYTAQGKGCWGVFERSDCRELAPVSATI
jgi:hypothetical protein